MTPDSPQTDPTASEYETEIKIGLSGAEDYARLRAALGPPAADIEQRNLFLDTPDGRLGQHRWALRLRLEQDVTDAPGASSRRDQLDAPGASSRRALLAVKGPARRIAGAVHRPDVEVDVDPALWDAAQRTGGLHPAELADAQEPLALLPPEITLDPHAPLQVRMSFDNRRSTYPLPLGDPIKPLDLLLDRTRYATGEIDHEIEVEVRLPAPPDAPASQLLLRHVRDDLNALLSRHGLTPGPPLGGKLSRALRYAEAQSQSQSQSPDNP